MKFLLSTLLVSLSLWLHGQELYNSNKLLFGNGNFPLSTMEIPSKKNFLLTPFIGPGYTPDAGMIFAGGGLISFKTNSHDSLIQRSSLPISVSYATRGSFSFNANLTSFWFSDKFRWNLDVYLKDAEDDYWGVGYDAGLELPQSDTTTGYGFNGFLFRSTTFFQLKYKIFGGLIVDFNRTKVTETNPVMSEDPAYLEYGPDNYNTGLGLTFQYDTRDLATNAYSGNYAMMSFVSYSDFLGGDNSYQIVEYDLRHYRSLEREGSVVAFLLKGRFGIGDVPYAELTKLGGSTNLRGYIGGQYRDQTGVIFLAEYRHKFKKPDGTLSKQGMVVWLGSGTISPEVSRTRQWVPNLGFGYRFEVQPRANVRIDAGIGRETSGIYFSFNEAF